MIEGLILINGNTSVGQPATIWMMYTTKLWSHSHCIRYQVLTSVWNPIIGLLSDYQICETLTHRHLWNSVDGDPQGSILTSDGMYDRVTAIFLSSSQQHQDIISIWKCLWLADQGGDKRERRVWKYPTKIISAPISPSVTVNSAACKCKPNSWVNKFVSSIWNSVFSANY